MVNVNADIISYLSIGDIEIGKNIVNYDFYHDPVFINSFSSSNPELTGRIVFYYDLDECMYVSTEEDGTIIALGCHENYKGKYNKKLYPGITMGELIKSTNSQRILNGTLVVDEDYGISFTLPSPYNEIADYIEHIPLDLKLNEIYVEDNSFWEPKGK